MFYISLTSHTADFQQDKDRLKIHVGNAAISMIKNAISTKNNDCSAYSRVSMLHFLQLLINKFGAAKEKLENEDRPLPKVMVELAANCTTKTEELEVERIYQTLAYFAGACLAAGDRSDKLLIDQMVIGMLDPRVGRKVAQSFRILLAPSPIMNEANFCVIRKLHKQRLYGLTVDNLISQWRNNRNKEQKENYLIALAGIFAYMDSKILEDQAAETFPLILEGTNTQNDDFTMFTYINLIKTLVVTCPSAVSDHIDSVINRMTDRTHNTYDSPSDASVKCRAAALDVLALLVGFVERRKLLPRKAKVMVELDIALDDCSRTVRSAAERTKMHWFNLVEVEN
jgi:DNA repair/transcription protein MET18/MMS19